MKRWMGWLVPMALLVLLAGMGGMGKSAEAEEAKRRHAMVIGLDGLRSDALKLAVESGRAPNIAGLIEEGAVTWTAMSGGWTPREDDPTRQATFSGPGWASVLTGVWRDKHGVNGNDFRGKNFERYPAMFQRLHEVDPQAVSSSLVSWAPINDHLVKHLGEAVCGCFTFTDGTQSQTDADLTLKTLELLETTNPKLVFYYQGNIDAAGHRFGFSPEVSDYMDAIELADARIGRVLAAVRARPGYAAEDWLYVLTSDHGGIGKGHGGHTPEERIIPFVASGGSVPKGMISEQVIGQVAVPATVFRHLGMGIPEEWGWEADGFGNGHGFEAADDGEGVRLTWSDPPAGAAAVKGYRIDKDGKTLAELGPAVREFRDADGGEGMVVYGFTAVGSGESRWTQRHTRPVKARPLLEKPDFRLDGESLDFPESGMEVKGKLRLVPGRVGQALSFGPGTALMLGKAGKWDMGKEEDFTVSMWVKLPEEWEADPVFLSNKAWSNGANPGFAIAAQDGRRNWQWNACGEAGGRRDFDPGGSPLGKETWHHLAVVFDRDADAIFYQNGGEIGRVSIKGTGSIDTANPWWLGQDGTGEHGWAVSWELDEFQIHRRTLTAGEVKGLAERPEAVR
ncbi:MAG: alkaline phosphatase family protein [Akkermansiaceae bacterium]|nr:alkaline phosphatase family protein [Akkermansiaceae bacterium]